MSCQQSELYGAEEQVPKGRSFATVSQIQEFVDGLREHDWWQRNVPQVLRVEAYRQDGRRRFSVGGWSEEDGAGVIEMLEVHWNELFVLHEVSHVVTAARYGKNAHGPWFARTYLELVSVAMGPDSYAALKESFVEHGIDHDHESYAPAGIQL
jgi:putative metallohydrolase (TIGR04338 family)